MVPRINIVMGMLAAQIMAASLVARLSFGEVVARMFLGYMRWLLDCCRVVVVSRMSSWKWLFGCC